MKRILTILMTVLLLLPSSGLSARTLSAEDEAYVEETTETVENVEIEESDDVEEETVILPEEDEEESPLVEETEEALPEQEELAVPEEETETVEEPDNGSNGGFTIPPLTFHGSHLDKELLKHENPQKDDANHAAHPSYYSLEDEGYVTSVKNQNPYGTCWSFATMASAESGILKKYGRYLDLSELQLAYYNYSSYQVADPLGLITNDGTSYTPRYELLDAGGWDTTPVFALASGIGFSDESDYPYEDANSYVNGSVTNDCYATTYRLNSARWLSMSESSRIKDYLMEYGALTVSYYHDGWYLNDSTNAYYQTSYNEYYSNHAVTLVGWDDNYSYKNFEEYCRPSKNGAWLIKNSWGEDWGNDGYFWISYYDASIKNGVAVFYEAEIDDLHHFKGDHIYQYDGSSLDENYSDCINDSIVYEANVYKTVGSREHLKEVGFFIVGSETDYTISIYKDVQSTPTTGTLALKQSGHLTDAGYYLIPLTEPVNLDKGEKFAVVVKLSSASGETIPILVDETTTYSFGSTRYKFYNSVTNDISYYSSNGITWYSFTDSQETARIKAITADGYATNEAYAVLTEDNDMIFFRSYQEYENDDDAIQTVTDVAVNTYTGIVYPDVESLSASFSDIPWDEERYNIKSVRVAKGQTIKPISMLHWFQGCIEMESFDGTGFDTSALTDMSSLFENCISLREIDLSGFDTSKVTDMWRMFYNCRTLKTLDLSSFDTSRVADMYGMFQECRLLTGLDLNNFDTSYVYDMSEMFSNCVSLVSLNLSSFDSSEVTEMGNMFEYCDSLGVVQLGEGFTKWIDDAFLPEGTWKNRSLGLMLSETELYQRYPQRASSWAGTWTRESDGDYVRIYRSSRLKESILVAEELKETLELASFDNIIVAKDSDFADALSGSYLAAKKDAPILLVGNSGFAEAYDYINQNLYPGGTVYILGSSSAVPDTFEEGLDTSDFTVVRLQGSSRYLTNLEILKEAGMTSSGDIFVVTGSGYADSLSSASVGLPILMVDNNATSLKNSQKKFLQANVTGKIYILGDTNAVNASLAKQLKSYGAVTRIGGASRWETTRLIAQKFFDYPGYVVLATGNDFADGLIASPLAYALHAPLLMCASDKTYQAKVYVQDHPVTKAYIVGSKSYISDAAARKILILDDDTVILER